MVRVLHRKLLRDLWAAKAMLAAIVGILVVGIASFTGMASVYLNLEGARRSYYARCRMADFSVSLKKLPVVELDRLESVPQITEIRPRISFPVIIDMPESPRPVSGRIISLPDSPAPIINNIVLRRGGYFTGQRREEVILNEDFARAHRLRPGDRLHVLLNHRRQELHVVGTAISSEFVYLIAPGALVPDPATYGILYVKQSFAEEVTDFQGACNELVGRLEASLRDRPDAVLREVETALEPFGVVTTTPRRQQTSHWFLSSELNGLRVSIVILPTIFLLVAALILNVLMTRLAEQQRTVVGTLKALGYRNGELLRHYLQFGASVGLAGGIIGTAAGYLLAEGMTGVYADFYKFPRLINRPAPGVMLAGVGLSLLFSLLGTWRGVRSLLRLHPAEAMRPAPPPQGHRIFLERLGLLWRRLGFRWQMVLRSLFRQRMRTAVTTGAASIGAALLLTTFHMRDAMQELIRFQYQKLLRADYELAFKDQRDGGALLEARQLPGVDRAEPVFQVACTFHHGHLRKQGSIVGLQHDAVLTQLYDTAGRPIVLPQTGLVLTRKLAELLQVRPGDRLTFVPVQGRRDRLQVPVMRVVDSYLGTAAYADFDYLNRLMGEEATLTQVQLKVSPERATTQSFYRELKRLPALQSVSAVRDQKKKLMRVLIEQMMISIFIVIVFAGMIFFGSLLNASLISLAERREEIALLRVLGYSSREVGGLFLRENLCLNITGTLLGLPLGFLFSHWITRLYNTELFRIPLVIRPESWWSTAALGVLFALLAHWPVRRAVRQMNWQQTLNVKE